MNITVFHPTCDNKAAGRHLELRQRILNICFSVRKIEWKRVQGPEKNKDSWQGCIIPWNGYMNIQVKGEKSLIIHLNISSHPFYLYLYVKCWSESKKKNCFCYPRLFFVVIAADILSTPQPVCDHKF